MKLYGSQTSPFVRRIRLLLATQYFEFINLNIFDAADRQTLMTKNPSLKIPMLEDDDEVIFDSGVIQRYVSAKLDLPHLSWKEENLLTLINAANDSLVALLLCQRSGFDTQADVLFFNLQHERIAQSLDALETAVHQGQFSQWRYPAMALFCLVDWIAFRELVSLANYPNLQAFTAQFQQQPGVDISDPRLAV